MGGVQAARAFRKTSNQGGGDCGHVQLSFAGEEARDKDVGRDAESGHDDGNEEDDEAVVFVF